MRNKRTCAKTEGVPVARGERRVVQVWSCAVLLRCATAHGQGLVHVHDGRATVDGETRVESERGGGRERHGRVDRSEGAGLSPRVCGAGEDADLRGRTRLLVVCVGPGCRRDADVNVDDLIHGRDHGPVEVDVGHCHVLRRIARAGRVHHLVVPIRNCLHDCEERSRIGDQQANKQRPENRFRGLLVFPALVSLSCLMRLPTCFAVRISPVFLRMYSAMNLLRFGKRVKPRGDLDSAGLYFSRPIRENWSKEIGERAGGEQTFHEGLLEVWRPYDLVLLFGHAIAFAAGEDGLEVGLGRARNGEGGVGHVVESRSVIATMRKA